MSEAHRTHGWRKLRNQRVAVGRANGEPCSLCHGEIDYTLRGNARWAPTAEHPDPLAFGGELLPPLMELEVAHRHCQGRQGAAISNLLQGTGPGSRGGDPATYAPRTRRKGGAFLGGGPPSPRAQPRNLAPRSGPSLSVISDISTPFTRHPRVRPDNAALPLMFSGPHPEAAGSYGDIAAEWIDARMAADPNAEGDRLLWHQWLILQRALEHRADGSLCWPLVLCEAPRQQAKTALLAELALWRSGNPGLFGEEQRVLHAARVASLADQVQGRAHLWAEDNGLKVSRRKADSYITWPDGSYWHVMALASVWGQRVGLALLDEGWDMSPAAFWSGLWPAMAQRRMRQAWVFSASNEGDRGLMASLRKIAQTLIIFWGAPRDADIADEAVWHAATPFMTPERLEGMRIASAAPGFAVEWLNIAPVAATRADWLPGWAGCAASAGDSRRGIGAVEVSADRSAYGAAVACWRGDGTIDVWTRSAPDLDTAAAWLAERQPAVVLAGISIRDQLLVPAVVQGVGVRETRFATPVLQEQVRNGRVRHDHGAELADEVGWARLTKTEHGDLLSAKASEGPIAGLKAVTWAVWAAATGAVAVEDPEIW